MYFEHPLQFVYVTDFLLFSFLIRQLFHFRGALKQLSCSTPAMTAQAQSPEPPSPKASSKDEKHTTSKARQKKFHRHFPVVDDDEKVLNRELNFCLITLGISFWSHMWFHVSNSRYGRKWNGYNDVFLPIEVDFVSLYYFPNKKHIRDNAVQLDSLYIKVKKRVGTGEILIRRTLGKYNFPLEYALIRR